MLIQNYANNNSFLMYFDCLSSMVNQQAHKPNEWHLADICNDKKSVSRNYKWLGVSGVASLRETVEMFYWEEGVNRCADLFGEIVLPELPSVKRKRGWGAKGSSVSLSKLYSGRFNKMYRTVKKDLSSLSKSKRNPINIVVDVTVNGKTNSEDYYWRGALASALTEALVKSGRSVRLFCASSTASFIDKRYHRGRVKGEKNLTICLLVKDYHERLDIPKTITLTSLSGVFRYYFFKSMLTLPFKLTEYLGSVSPLNADVMAPIMDNNPVIIIEDIWNKHAAMAKAKQVLDEL